MKHLFFLFLLGANAAFAQISFKTPFSYDGKRWGYTNTKKRVVIKPIYDSTGLFINKTAIVGKNKKYGVIDFQGKAIIPIQYDFIYREANIFNLQQGNTSIWVDTRGKKIKQKEPYVPAQDAIYNIPLMGHYAGSVEQKIYILVVDENDNVLDTLDKFDKKKGNLQIYVQEKEFFYKKHKNWFLGNVNYATNLVKNENQYTVTMCFTGNEWCSTEKTHCQTYKCHRYTFANLYDSLQLYKMDMLHKPYLKAYKNNKIGLLTIEGQEIIPPSYDDIECTTGDYILTKNNLKGLYFTESVLINSKFNTNKIVYKSIHKIDNLYKMQLPTGKTGYWVKIPIGTDFKIIQMF